MTDKKTEKSRTTPKPAATRAPAKQKIALRANQAQASETKGRAQAAFQTEPQAESKGQSKTDLKARAKARRGEGWQTETQAKQKAGKAPNKPAPSPIKKSLKSGNSIVRPESIAGNALSMVIGIMAFLASLTLGAVIMISQAASDWQTDISTEVTIQIKPFDNVEMEKAIQQVNDIVLSFEGVSSVTVLDNEANERLLEPWLGTGLDLDELPIPRLLTVSLVEGATPDFSRMRERITSEVPGASLDDHRAWVGRLANMAFATVTIGIAIFSLVMIATILTVVFATRGAMASNRQVVEVLHFVGAENQFIAGQFQKHFLALGLRGAMIGAALALLLFYSLALWSSHSVATPEGDQISALFGTFTMGWAGYFGILLVLLLIALLTALTSRFTVHHYVEQLHRFGEARKH